MYAAKGVFSCKTLEKETYMGIHQKKPIQTKRDLLYSQVGFFLKCMCLLYSSHSILVSFCSYGSLLVYSNLGLFLKCMCLMYSSHFILVSLYLYRSLLVYSHMGLFLKCMCLMYSSFVFPYKSLSEMYTCNVCGKKVHLATE